MYTQEVQVSHLLGSTGFRETKKEAILAGEKRKSLSYPSPTAEL
jgi:hypothetical protein